SALHVPEQAPALGDLVDVFVRVPVAAGVRGVHVRTTPDGEPRYTEAKLDREHGSEAWWRVAVQVRNPVTRYRFLLDTFAGPQWLTGMGLTGHDVPDATDFRLVAHAPPPAWSTDAVVYQIFPDRFARSAAAADRALPDWAIRCDWDTPVIGHGPQAGQQFYGGDLDGIAEHLDHIESLGADTVYLTPIFPARSNHRYDAAGFDTVDPLLGGDEALIRLRSALHRRGLRLLGDLTTNHCGDSHPWFLAAAADPAAGQRELFYFQAGEYEAWLGVPSLPKLNWASAQLRARFCDGDEAVARRWLRPPYSLDGWRVDVANMTGRRGADDFTHEVARMLRATVADVAPDALLVAEHAHDATADLDRDGWHGTMNYAGFTRPVWTWLRSDTLALTDFLGMPGGVPRRPAESMVATMRAFAASVSWRAWANSWTMLGSHDTARIRTVVGDPGRVEVGLGLLLTLPGVPMIFAGDELGLVGVNGEDARRPMPWHRPADWDHATLARARSLIQLRRDSAALRQGGLRWAYLAGDAVAYLRESATERMLVLARRAAGGPVRLAGLDAANLTNVYGGAEVSLGPGGSVELPGDGPTLQIWRLH
ncbi:MAG TPA: glycoside hydrolase family 13 protein, partial [Micromonosporaceae bacterium]